MRHLESAHQQQVIEWARWASRSAKYPMLNMLHCSLNGVKLSKTQAGIAKAQGMLSGVPDLFLQNAANVGFAVYVCYSAQEAIKRIEDYYKD